MWLFTRLGFFSAVCARKGKGGCSNEVDTDRIMVRARIKAHLEALIKAYPEQLCACKIHESSNSDYRCRIFVPKSLWAAVVGQLVMETDYDNFKSACKDAHAGGDYISALHRVWGTMYGLQSRTYGSGIYDRPHRFDPPREFDDVNGGDLLSGLRDDTPQENEPEVDDEVFVVFGAGDKVVGTIWWAEDYVNGDQAYREAVEHDAIPLVDPFRVCRVPWAELNCSATPIYDGRIGR